MIDINDPKVRSIKRIAPTYSAVKKLDLVGAIRLARENNITLEFHPKSVCATKERHSSVIKYSQCKNHDEATILAIEDCLERFNQLTRKH